MNEAISCEVVPLSLSSPEKPPWSNGWNVFSLRAFVFSKEAGNGKKRENYFVFASQKSVNRLSTKESVSSLLGAWHVK